MEDENKKHKKTKKKSPHLEGSALVYPRGATPRGWEDAGYTDLMATQAVPEWKVSRSTVPQRALVQLAGSTTFVLSNETHVGDNHGSAPREGASATAELLPNAGDPRPLSARQRRYLNRSRDSQRKKTHAKRPSKKHVKARRLDVKESPLITLRHKYMKPRAMNPSDVSKTTPANTSMTESKAPRVNAFSVSGKALGTDATHFENESYRFVHHPSTTARGEPISANWNFTPNVAASHSHDYSRDRSLNALVASFQTQMRKQGKLFQHRMEQLHRAHERDLANVVLAYDAHTETLEHRCKQYQVFEARNKRLLEKSQIKARRQQENMAEMRREILSLKRLRSKGMRGPGWLKSPMAAQNSMLSGSISPQSVIQSQSGFVAVLPGGFVVSSPTTGDQEGWHSPGSGSDNDKLEPSQRQSESTLFLGTTTAGSANRDSDENGEAFAAGISTAAEDREMGEGGGVSSDVLHRLRDEIRQYQEALAESAQTIEMLQNDNWQEVARLRDSETELKNLVKSLELTRDQGETALVTASTKSEAAQEELTKTRVLLDGANEEIKTLYLQASQMRAERTEMQRDVEKSEAKINAQLREVAVAMKQTLKQCHMLEELIRPEITCNQCMEVLKDAQVLYPCGHSFCDSCVDEMERESDQCIVCSLCQAVVPRADTCPNMALQAICPRVAWWSEPIALLKRQFQEFSGREFVLQQTFGTMPTSASAALVSGGVAPVAAIADATTIQMLVRVALAIKKAGVGVAELFERFDTDHGGSVDSKEMKEGLHSIGMWLTDEEFERLMKCADPDGDGDVMYAEFAELLDHAMMTRDGRNAGAARQAAALDPVVEAARRKGY